MSVERLRAQHRDRADGSPLVLPGPWDAASARVFAAAGFEALATPSHGVSESLGYRDGEAPADEMFAAVARIVRAVGSELPVTADIERGYGLPVGEIVDRLLATGAVGCNLEDSADGVLIDHHRQAEWLAEVHAAADGRIFLNARIDTYVRGAADPLAEAVERGRLYVAAGAECVYPIGAPPGDIGVLAAELGVPVNAYCGTGGPSGPGGPRGSGVRELAAAGASRITFAGDLQARATRAVEELARDLRAAAA